MNHDMQTTLRHAAIRPAEPKEGSAARYLSAMHACLRAGGVQWARASRPTKRSAELSLTTDSVEKVSLWDSCLEQNKNCAINEYMALWIALKGGRSRPCEEAQWMR